MTAENNLQLNRRILSVVMFTFVCYLTIGLPLAVLPGFVHDHLGYNSVLAKLSPTPRNTRPTHSNSRLSHG